MLRVARVGLGDAGKHLARARASLASEGALAWTAICARDAGRAAACRAELSIGDSVATFGTLGARGDGELWQRARRKSAVAIAFEPANPYAAQLRDFVAGAPSGFHDDPRLLANVAILDRIAGQRQGAS